MKDGVKRLCDEDVVHSSFAQGFEDECLELRVLRHHHAKIVCGVGIADDEVPLEQCAESKRHCDCWKQNTLNLPVLIDVCARRADVWRCAFAGPE